MNYKPTKRQAIVALIALIIASGAGYAIYAQSDKITSLRGKISLLEASVKAEEGNVTTCKIEKDKVTKEKTASGATVEVLREILSASADTMDDLDVLIRSDDKENRAFIAWLIKHGQFNIANGDLATVGVLYEDWDEYQKASGAEYKRILAEFSEAMDVLGEQMEMVEKYKELSTLNQGA